MPQIAKGGKFVFGWSIINPDGRLRIPEMAHEEYHLSNGSAAVLFSGSKKSGGFCVSNHALMKDSVFTELFIQHPGLHDHSLDEGACVRYKGRHYCRVTLHPGGIISLPAHTMRSFSIKPGDRLLAIRGSNIAFVLAVKGPLIEAATRYKGTIDEYTFQEGIYHP